eukprot:09652.XXX_542697_542392_1 [CDS] Oithona nana genome sequencing.
MGFRSSGGSIFMLTSSGSGGSTFINFMFGSISFLAFTDSRRSGGFRGSKGSVFIITFSGSGSSTFIKFNLILGSISFLGFANSKRSGGSRRFRCSEES